MKIPRPINLFILGMTISTSIACANEKTSHLKAERDPATSNVPDRQGLSILSQKSQGPLKGWYLVKTAATYDGSAPDLGNEEETLAKLCAQARKLIGHGDNALTVKMKQEHFSLEVDPSKPNSENEVYADRALHLLKSTQDEFGIRRVAKMLDDAESAVIRKKYEVARHLWTAGFDLSQTRYNDFHKVAGTWTIDDSLWRLESALKEQARYTDLEAVLKAILERDNRLKQIGDLKGGDYTRAQAADYFELGYCAFMQKNYSQAEQNYKKALARRQTLYGKGHSCTLRVMNHLARVYAAENRTTEAIALKKQTVNLPNCPVCHSNIDVIPVSYGNPSGVKLVHFAQEFAIGGCRHQDAAKSPNWHCVQCQKNFFTNPSKRPAGAHS